MYIGYIFTNDTILYKDNTTSYQSEGTNQIISIIYDYDFSYLNFTDVVTIDIYSISGNHGFIRNDTDINNVQYKLNLPNDDNIYIYIVLENWHWNKIYLDLVKVFVNNDINVYNNSIMASTFVINSITSNKNLYINNGLLIDNISLSTISIFNY